VEKMLEKVFGFINFAPVGSTGETTGGDAGQSAAAGGGSMLWIILIFFVLMYVLLILPQKKQEKKHKQMISELQKGDKIITSSGIIGKILSVQNDRIKIVTGDRTEIDITKNAVSAIIGKKDSDNSKEQESSKESQDKTEDKKSSK
jgi:preprotein translocase subunit YajC